MGRYTICIVLAISIFQCKAVPAKFEKHDIEIVGGIVSNPGNLPEVAAIIRDSAYLHCTGVLIAPKVVLTAGHCTGSNLTHVLLDTYDFDDPGEIIEVEQVIAYPEWRAMYDIALLILKEASATTPVQIAHGCAAAFIVDDADAIIAGWGAIDLQGNIYPDKLHEAVTTIVDAECADCKPAISPGGELITHEDGVGACFGDSGGPLYVSTEAGDFLAGVASTTLSLEGSACGNGEIYTRPDAVIGWIKSQIGVDLAEPTCSAGPLIATMMIKPGSIGIPKVSPGARGVIPVALLTTQTDDGEAYDFDALTVDPSTIVFGPGQARPVESGIHTEDVDDDGDDDLFIHFDSARTGIICGDEHVDLEAQTADGQPVVAIAAIATVGCKRFETPTIATGFQE